MRTKQRLSLFWITTLISINFLNGQITFINPPSDTTVTCENIIAFPELPEVTDDCPGDPFIFINDSSTKSNATDTCAFYEYIITRKFSAMNSCFDTTIYIQTITVIDTIPPVFQVPPPVTVNCSELNNLNITGNVTNQVDQCGGRIQAIYNDEFKSVRCDSTITRTWIASDVCGNTSTGIQAITIIDDVPPTFVAQPRDISVMCSMTPNPYLVFNDWVRNMGYASYTDACNEVTSTFAAVPGSYDLNDPSTFPGVHPEGLNPPECGVIDGAIQFETVDFVIVDACGNAFAQAASFFYEDDIFPTLTNCEPDITVNIDGSDCFTTINYAVPSGFDSCGIEDLEIIFSDIKTITSSSPGDPDVVVNDVNFRLGPYGPEIEFVEENYFTVNLNNFDGNDAGETFVFLDESGSPIGISQNTDEECGSVSFEIGPFSKQTVDRWAEDQYINFRMVPSVNSNPSESINDICSASSAEIRQVQIIKSQVDSVQMFFSLDDDTFTPINDLTIDVDLNAGPHVVKFMAQDCAGNRTTCPQRVTVRDGRSPQLNCGVSRQVETNPGLCGFSLPLSEIAIINNPCDEEISISVEIEGAMNALIRGNYDALLDSTIIFPIGSSIINVEALDFSGNRSGCSFNIGIEDNELPIAICENIEAEAVAVALEQFSVNPSQLAGNSTDNCGIRNIVIENNDYTCDDLGSTFTKNVLVFDNSNNVSTCESTFTIVDAPVPISYTVGICPEDSLKFFLNIPKRDQYVYDWNGPLGFKSVLAEPFIPEVSAVHEGLYTLTIRNVNTGCESTASIEVLIEDIKEPVIVTDEIGCETIPHLLSTDPIPGVNIRYDWYVFSGSTRSLLTSSDTSFVRVPLTPGTYKLAVVISNGFCESRPSNRIDVEIRESPIGAICTNLIEGCIGRPLELCVDDPEEQFIIRWFGPNDFYSEEEKPMVTDSFTAEFSGVYKLVIEDNLCITDTLTTSVTTNMTPDKPAIIGDRLYCSGDTIVLTSSIGEVGDVFIWHSPSGTIRNNQPTLMIPNAGMNFNGLWQLSIERGPCESERSEPLLLDIEPVFLFDITTDRTQCVGSKVTLTTTAPPESMFQWEGPNGFFSNEFNPVVDIESGTYFATVTTRNGCTYFDNITMNTVVVPDIFSVDVSEEGPCLDPNSSVTIIPTLSQSADVFYEWTGPRANTSSSSLTIDNFEEVDNGVYSVKVLNGACESELFTFGLNYIISPDQPTLDTDPVACIGDSLFLGTANYGVGATYSWNTPSGILETNDNQLELGDVVPEQSGNYAVEVTIGECTSPVSEIVEITVNENTFVPTILTTGNQCLQSDYKIYADLSGDLTLEWELPDGNQITADTIHLNLQTSDAGNYRVRSLANGCPSEWSGILNIDVADPRDGLSLSTDFIFSCNNDDSGLEFCVDDNAGLQGERYRWFLGDMLIGESSANCYQVQDPSIFRFGFNEVTLQIVYNGCEVEFDEVLTLEIENVRNIDFDAGQPQLYCVGQELIMNADEVNTAKLSAFWSVDAGVEVDDIKDPMATITVLEDLDSTYAVWNIEHIECGVVFKDSVILRQKVKPLPVNDTLVMESNEVTFNPLENDILISGNNYEVTEVSEPRWGRATVAGVAISYTADPKFIGGEIKFNYTVCDDACEVLCNEGEVILFYNAESCRGNNVLTPNNDGANDRFVIPCVANENLPNSSLVILNEVGNTVYEQSPYDNSWDGTFNGEPLSEGTYYYIFRKNDDATVVQGFISIER
ncbi:T9SS type B sorting domain-containing protein [Portibacter marinus]|uniref:T9SS type B sorting domain-containing protein n=1 Tax=Portibacter marinus TaxID=2898660 RepID=UPI001F19AB4E|nr:gliding motility-associated C-terminal domain-containing protein [Portibacter marinus]